jgi:hypothetical protein
MEAHPTATQMVSSVFSIVGWGILLGIVPVLGYLMGDWSGAVAGVVISMFIIGYMRGYVRGQTGLVSWLTLIGGGVLGYQFGGWAGAIAGALGLFVGSAFIMGGRRGRREARELFASWKAAGEPGLGPRPPGATDAQRQRAIFAAVQAYKLSQDRERRQEMVFDRCKLVGEGVIDHRQILEMARHAYADSAYYDQYRFGHRMDRFAFWAMNGLTSLHGNPEEAAMCMPWASDPGLRERVVPLVKVELAEALLQAGATPSDAVTEVNASLGPPNLAAMFLGGAKGRRVAERWSKDYGSKAAARKSRLERLQASHADRRAPEQPKNVDLYPALEASVKAAQAQRQQAAVHAGGAFGAVATVSSEVEGGLVKTCGLPPATS